MTKPTPSPETATPEQDMANFNQFEQVEYSNGPKHVYGIDSETGKKVHLSHDAVLEHYGYGPENTSTNDPKPTADEKNGAEDEVDNPWKEREEAQEKLDQSQSKIDEEKKKIKLQTSKWRSRVKLYSDAEDVRDKQREDENYVLTEDDIEAIDQMAHQEKLDKREKKDPITEDDIRYYRLQKDEEETKSDKGDNSQASENGRSANEETETEVQSSENEPEETGDFDLISHVEEQNGQTDEYETVNEDKPMLQRVWERAKFTAGNIASGNVKRRNVLIGAAVGFITAVGIQKLTGDHESVKHIANHSGIGPDNTLAAHNGQSFADALRENGYQHPNHLINHLNDSGVLENGDHLTRGLSGNVDHPHQLVVDNFVDQRGAEGRMFIDPDLASALPEHGDKIKEVTSSGLTAVEAGAIGAAVGGVGAGVATRSGEKNSNNQTENRRNENGSERLADRERQALEERISYLEEQAALHNRDRMLLNRSARAMYAELSDEQRRNVEERLQREAQEQDDDEN